MKIKCFDKIQHPFIRKTLSKLRREGDFLNLMKDIYTNLKPVITTNDKIVNTFPPNIRKKARMSLLTIFILGCIGG